MVSFRFLFATYANKIKTTNVCSFSLVKIYTKTGDDGTTGLIGGTRVKKTSTRIIAYGAVDEINSAIGIVLASEVDSDIRVLLTKIQNDLFLVGSDLANPNLKEASNRVTDDMVNHIEKEIDRLESELSPITYFILPGGNLLAAQIHLARAICRRAEVNIVKISENEEINTACRIYINRLSDLFFVLARTINSRKKIKDTAWTK